MKKGMIFFIIFFILLFTAISNSKTNFVAVDERIESVLEENEEVSVIVMLKDDYGSIKKRGVLSVDANNLKTKKEMIKKQQENVLSELNIGSIKKASSEKESLKTIKKLNKIEQTEKAEFELRHKYRTVNGFSGKVTKAGLEKLKQNPDVERVYIDRVLHIFLDASVPLINTTKTWSLIYNNTNLTGAGETVCIIDTGVDYNHTNLGGGWGNKVIGGYNSISGAGGGGVLGNQSCDINNTACYDDHGHGTHVAGIVASDNDTYRGVAPDAKIVAIKACDSGGSCADSDVIAGIDWCTNNASIFNISVISMSLGTTSTYTNYCDDDYTADRDAINTAVGENISVVVATANQGSSTQISSPACIENATPIGATSKNDAITSYSNRNSLVLLLAPGGTSSDCTNGICSTNDGGGFVGLYGTSMSTPHAAGAFALINQYRRLEGSARLTPAEIEDALNDTGKAIADGANTYRRINIYAAILSLDSVAPTINITYPANNSKTNTTWVFINITSNEILTSAILEINNTNTTMNGSVLNWYFNKTGLNQQTYTYVVYGNDSAGNIGISETRVVNINNTTPKQPTLNLPLNNSYTSLNWSLLNWTAFDDDNDTVTCYVYGDNTTAPSTLINTTTNIENGSISTYNWTSLNETTYYWKVRCADSYVNSSFSSLFNFTIDLTYPKIEFAGGTKANNSYNESNWIYVNVSVTEINFNNITFMLYNSTSIVNETNFTTAVYNLNFTNLSDGSYYYNVTIRDKTAKINSTETRKITIDTTIPTTNVSLTSVDDYDDDGNIELNWTDDLVELYSRNATINYRILRSITKINSSNIATASLVSNTTTNTTQFFEDNTTVHNTNYFYAIVTVDSFNRFNDSVISVVLNATANDTIAPKEATNFNVTGSGATATFRWYNVTQDVNNNPDETNLRYVIYYKNSDSAVNTSKSPINKTDWDGVAQNVTTNKSITWSTTTEGTYTYHFVATTLDDGGNENLSLTTGANGNYGNISLTYTAPTSNGGSSSGGGGGGGGTATASEGVSASKMWSVLTKGTSTMSISKSAIAVTELVLNMKNQVSNAEVTVTKLDKKPSAISHTPTGEIYQYLKIDKKKIANADFKNIKIKFRVTKSWLITKDINEGDVVLKKYTTRWIGLPTKKISSDSSYATYEATTSGFSYFAITGKEAEIKIAEFIGEEEATEEEVKEIKEEAKEEIKEEKKKFFKLFFVSIPLVIAAFLTAILAAFFVLKSKRILVLRAKRHHKKAREHHHRAKKHHKAKAHNKARKQHLRAIIHHRGAVKHYLKINKPEHIEKARHHEKAANKHIEAIKHIDAGNLPEIERIDRELEDIDEKLGE